MQSQITHPYNYYKLKHPFSPVIIIRGVRTQIQTWYILCLCGVCACMSSTFKHNIKLFFRFLSGSDFLMHILSHFLSLLHIHIGKLSDVSCIYITNMHLQILAYACISQKNITNINMYQRKYIKSKQQKLANAEISNFIVLCKFIFVNGAFMLGNRDKDNISSFVLLLCLPPK